LGCCEWCRTPLLRSPWISSLSQRAWSPAKAPTSTSSLSSRGNAFHSKAHVQWAAHPTRRQEHFQGQCFRRLEQTGARGQVLGQGRRIRLGAGSRWCGSTLARSRLKRGQDELFEAWLGLKSLGGGVSNGRSGLRCTEVAWAADGGGVGGGGAHDRLTPFTLSLHPV